MSDSNASGPQAKSLLLKAIQERDYETMDQLLTSANPSAFKAKREHTDKVCSLTEREQAIERLKMLVADDKRRNVQLWMLFKSVLEKRLDEVMDLFEEDQKAETQPPDKQGYPSFVLALYDLTKKAEGLTAACMSLPSLAQDPIKLTIEQYRGRFRAILNHATNDAPPTPFDKAISIQNHMTNFGLLTVLRTKSEEVGVKTDQELTDWGGLGVVLLYWWPLLVNAGRV
ncbi:MAG: hypothetical protein LQ350_005467 [Teloschistes chrysophthalmus]|nr:MAG: hypothetical protein LQ350_005467 [Niorma chrysophthalma]